MNERPWLTSDGVRTGPSLQKILRTAFRLLGIFGLAIAMIAFSLHGEFLEAKSGAATDGSKNHAGATFLVPRKSHAGVIQNPAADAQLTLASTVGGVRPINPTTFENVFQAGRPAAGLPPIPGASTGVQMVAGLAFLIWIQRLRRLV